MLFKIYNVFTQIQPTPNFRRKIRRALGRWSRRIGGAFGELFFWLALAGALALGAYFGRDILSLVTSLRGCDPDPGAAANPCQILAEGGAFKVISTVVLTMAGLLTLAFGYRRSKAMADNARNMTRQVELSRREQLSRRFTESVKQLGDASITIRFGGIAGLWAMAKESDHPEDRVMVLDVLCAFVREAGEGKERTEDDSSDDDQRRHLPPPKDIGMIIAKVTSIAPDFVEMGLGHTYRRDLRGANLCRLEMNGANFIKARLNGADLRWAELPSADFTEADLTDAKLSGTDLSEANLTGAKFTKATIINAILFNANLMRAIASRANFSHTSLFQANLSESHLAHAIFYKSSLSECNFSGARLQGSNFTLAYLTGANLAGADLTGAKLSKSQYESAITDEHTIPPKTFLHEYHKDA